MPAISERHVAISIGRLIEMVALRRPFAIYGYRLWSNRIDTDSDDYRYENTLLLFDGQDIYICNPSSNLPALRTLMTGQVIPGDIADEPADIAVRRITEPTRLVRDFKKLPLKPSIIHIHAPGIGDWTLKNPKPAYAKRWASNIIGSILKHHLHYIRANNVKIVVETDVATRFYIDTPDTLPDAFDVMKDGTRSRFGGEFVVHGVRHTVESELAYLMRKTIPTVKRQIGSILSDTLITRMGIGYLIDAYTEPAELPRVPVEWIPRSRITDWPEGLGNGSIQTIALMACGALNNIHIPKKRIRMIIPESVPPVCTKRSSKGSWSDVLERTFVDVNMPIQRQRFGQWGVERVSQLEAGGRTFHNALMFTVRARKGRVTYGHGGFSAFRVIVASGEIYVTDMSRKTLAGPYPLADVLPFRNRGTVSFIALVPGQMPGFNITIPDKDMPAIAAHWSSREEYCQMLQVYYTLGRENLWVHPYADMMHHFHALLYSALPSKVTLRELATVLYLLYNRDYDSILHRLVPGWTVYHSEALKTPNLKVSLDVAASSMEWASSVALTAQNML